MLRYEYARSALKTGLRLEDTLGTNPYRFGMIGSTVVPVKPILAKTDLSSLSFPTFFIGNLSPLLSFPTFFIGNLSVPCHCKDGSPLTTCGDDERVR